MDFPTRRRPFCYGDVPDEPPTVFVGFAVAGVFVISFAADSVGDFSRYERNLVYGFRFAPGFVYGGFCNCWNMIRQVPKDATIQQSGFHTYWYFSPGSAEKEE